MEKLEKFLDSKKFNNEFEILILCLQYSAEMFNQDKFSIEDIISFKGFVEHYAASKSLNLNDN